MILARPFLILSLAFSFAFLASPAEAARKKGRKKGGEHGHSGMVESVNHKTGTFVIKASHHRGKGKAVGQRKGMARKGKGMARRGKGKSMVRRPGQGTRSNGGGNLMFHVHRGTKFQGGSFQTLRKGEHVLVMAQGQRADDVKIGMGKGKGKGKGQAKPKRKKKATV